MIDLNAALMATGVMIGALGAVGLYIGWVSYFSNLKNQYVGVTLAVAPILIGLWVAFYLAAT